MLACFRVQVSGKVPAPPSETEMNAMMCEAMEWGALPGYSLVMLQRVLKDVYLPMVDPESRDVSSKQSISGAASHAAYSADVKAEELSDSMRNEFSGNMQKFLGQI